MTQRIGIGARALIVIASHSSSDTYKFTINGASSLVQQPDGSVDVVNGSKLLATIAPAWARDARGVSVPTSYSINGLTITQTVDTAAPGIMFPVTADPFINVLRWLWHGFSDTVNWAMNICGRSAAEGGISTGFWNLGVRSAAYYAPASQTAFILRFAPVLGPEEWITVGGVSCVGQYLFG